MKKFPKWFSTHCLYSEEGEVGCSCTEGWVVPGVGLCWPCNLKLIPASVDFSDEVDDDGEGLQIGLEVFRRCGGHVIFRANFVVWKRKSVCRTPARLILLRFFHERDNGCRLKSSWPCFVAISSPNSSDKNIFLFKILFIQKNLNKNGEKYKKPSSGQTSII